MNAVHPLSSTPEPDLLDALHTQHQRLNAALEATPRQEWRNQYHPDLSPMGWHYAHCQFIEAVWLQERILGKAPCQQHDWHTLYFPELSPKWRRGGRLPSAECLLTWGRECQERHRRLLREDPQVRQHPLLEQDYLVGFLAQHHAMHLESLEQVRWWARLARPTPPVPGPTRPRTTTWPTTDWTWIPGGEASVGSDAVITFDNERSPHPITLEPYAIRSQPVSNAEIIAFVESGGYAPEEHWGPDGKAWLKRTGISAPLGWWRLRDGAHVQTLPDGTHTLEPEAPAVGLSWFEANAYARWANARLPHEHEWEHAARSGILRDTGHVWEWCANTFQPYPRFRPFPYDEYSAPWFDGAHYVLRGGSAWSDPLLKRPTMRNFFTPDKRHVFSGFRLARSL